MDQIEGQQSSGPLSGLLRVDPQQALAVLGRATTAGGGGALGLSASRRRGEPAERARSHLPGEGRQKNRQAHPGGSGRDPPGDGAARRKAAQLAGGRGDHPHRGDDGDGGDPQSFGSLRRAADPRRARGGRPGTGRADPVQALHLRRRGAARRQGPATDLPKSGRADPRAGDEGTPALARGAGEDSEPTSPSG